MSFTQIEFLLSVFFALGATQQFDLINGSKHAVSSSITCVASIQVISGVTYDLQWRFNKTKICDVFVQLNKIQTMSCSSTIPGFEYYGINSNVSASLSPANFLQMTFKYENLKPENYILDLSLYNDRDTTEYNQTNLEVRYCDSSSDGMPIGAATTPSQCEYGCSANLSCVPDYYSSIVTAQCQADATWSEVNNCTQITTTAPSTPEVTTFNTTAIASVNSTFPGETTTMTATTTIAPTTNTTTASNTTTPSNNATTSNNTTPVCVCSFYHAGIAGTTILSIEGIAIIVMFYYLKKFGFGWLKKERRNKILFGSAILCCSTGLVCCLVVFLLEYVCCSALTGGQVAATAIGSMAVFGVVAYDVHLGMAFKKQG